MWTRVLAVGSVGAASLIGQAHFSWQDACFKNPAAPYCQGHDYAVKPQPKAPPAPRTVITNPSPSTPRAASATRTGTPSMIAVGRIDWRFADPLADALVGLNFSGISTSPLAQGLLTQLGIQQGILEAGVDQVAFSVRNNRVVAMITGSVADSSLPAPDAGLKAVPISGGVMLIGHTDAVDQAVQRIAMKGPPNDVMRAAEQRQASSEFWVTGSAALFGPQAMSAGAKRFALTVWIRDRLTSDVVLEFNGTPSANTLKTWQTQFGAATVEGTAVHARTALEADEVQQKFAQLVAGPLGPSLATLVEAARYLPVRDSAVPKQTKPVIYGLDDERH